MAALPTARFQGRSSKYATGAKPSIKLLTEDKIIGTWNIHTLHACGKLYELTHELNCYHLDIMGLAKVRWTGFGELTLD